MHTVSLNINVDFQDDGKCEGTIICDDRMITIKPGIYGHLVIFEQGFVEIRVPELELPVDGPEAVGFAVGTIFGEISPKWALEALLKSMSMSAGNLETIGNA